MTLSQTIAAALIASPIPGLPEDLGDLSIRSQYDIEESELPMLVISETSTQNLTRNSLRKVTWEARLHVDPDDTPPAVNTEALQVIEKYLRSSAFFQSVKNVMPQEKSLLHMFILGIPNFRIDDRVVTDTILANAHVGLNAPVP